MSLKERYEKAVQWFREKGDEKLARKTRKRLEQITDEPKLTGIDDSVIWRDLVNAAIGQTPDVNPNPDRPNIPAEPVGLTKLDSIINANEALKFYTKISNLLLVLAKWDLRNDELTSNQTPNAPHQPQNPAQNRSTPTESILTYLGFSRDFVLKYFQAIFGQFGNARLNTEDGVKTLLKEKKTFKQSLYFDAMGLIDQNPQALVQNHCNTFLANAARLQQIGKLEDLDKMINVMKEILKEELERARRGDIVTRLTYPEMRKKAQDIGGYAVKVNPRPLGDDIKELERMIAEQNARFAPQPAQPNMPPNLDFAKLLQDASPELTDAIGRLKRLYSKFKSLDDQAKLDLAYKINQIAVARGNMLGLHFHASVSPDVITMLVNVFGITNNAELEAKIMEIDTEFTPIYQAYIY